MEALARDEFASNLGRPPGHGVKGILSSEAFHLKRISGTERYYVPSGTLFALDSDKPDTVLTSEKQQPADLVGILFSKEPVTLTPDATSTSEKYFTVPDNTSFHFSTDDGQHRSFKLDRNGILLKAGGSNQFKVPEEIALTEVTTEMSVVLTYYFSVDIKSSASRFSPENIQKRLKEDYQSQQFNTIDVYNVVLDVGKDPFTSSTTPFDKLIGLSVTINNSYVQPSEVQRSLQDYFNKGSDVNKGSATYKVLPPPHWVNQ